MRKLGNTATTDKFRCDMRSSLQVQDWVILTQTTTSLTSLTRRSVVSTAQSIRDSTASGRIDNTQFTDLVTLCPKSVSNDSMSECFRRIALASRPSVSARQLATAEPDSYTTTDKQKACCVYLACVT